MPYSGERELLELASITNARHQVEELFCHSTVINSEPELFLSKRISGKRMEKSLMEWRHSDRTKLGSSRTENTTDNIASRQEPSLTALQEAQQAAE